MQTYQDLVAQFEKYLKDDPVFPDYPNNLYEPCHYLLGLGGKRIRPAACLMAAELFGPITQDAWSAALAIELFHNFTLIHDDIMDKAPLRRGFPTIHAKYGLTAGILGGDAMSIYAYQALGGVENNFKRVLELFNTTAIQVCEGQQLDMDFEQRAQVQISEYIEMIRLKTSVLLAASLKIGGLLNNCSSTDADQLYDFGINLGIAFQLQDDYLDAFGDSRKVGKQTGGDIRANKKTYLHIAAWERATHSQKERMKELLNQESNEDQKVDEMLNIFDTTGAKALCQAQVNAYSQAALANLEALDRPTNHKQQLLALAKDLLHREQ